MKRRQEWWWSTEKDWIFIHKKFDFCDQVTKIKFLVNKNSIFSFTLFDITDMKEWYGISVLEFKKHGGGGLYQYYQSMTKLLTTIYPKYSFRNLISLIFSCYPWEIYRFSKPHHVPRHKKTFSKQQRLLFEYTKQVHLIVLIIFVDCEGGCRDECVDFNRGEKTVWSGCIFSFPFISFWI